MHEIGFMQGRLSEPVDGKIQGFPWDHWEEEIAVAGGLQFQLMEWTLDEDSLRENPLMTQAGRARIRTLSDKHRVRIRSLTGDCFMQEPFYKISGQARTALLNTMVAILDSCSELGVRQVVFPLVDNGSLQTPEQEESLKEGLLGLTATLRAREIRLVFESDYPPARLARLISVFPPETFGINYDIGNSASLGFDPVEEIGAYGPRICNVHVKDRVLGGTTVPLGKGNADFQAVFKSLRRIGYTGDFILQTARASDHDHADALCRYRDMTRTWWDESEPRS